MTIGALSRATGVKVTTIRYYETIGLMARPARTASGHRRYTTAERDQLAFIRQARRLGFELDAIRELLELARYPEQSCSNADSIARRQKAEIEARIRRLETLDAELARMIADCEGGRTADCRVLEALTGS
ncbi:MerR family transcriptional regulator [Marinicauda pacifica]|uniref:MerR family transcriptional regulator n=2 Tax=Maricaulaceae TaxID=2800061 RepID=A0A4S2HBW1_9PROT|nr:MerR family transcriptional regulator [Marinicauda pacifica]